MRSEMPFPPVLGHGRQDMDGELVGVRIVVVANETLDRAAASAAARGA